MEQTIPQIRLYTPLPPARTGPAFYAELLLRDLHRAGIPPEALTVVVEDAPPAARTREGYPVVSCRAVPNVVTPGEVAVFAIANNDHHGFIHACLRDVNKVGKGRVVALLHDPACWMVLNKLSAQRLHGFTDEALVGNLAAQYGARARTFFEQFRRGELPRLFEHTTHALAHVLAKADEVWTHSAFAALKLTLESNLPLPALPRFRLVQFPAYEEPLPAPSETAEHFTIGAFGWVAAPKRILEAIEGFYRFLCRLDRAGLAKARMIVAGELPEPGRYDPAGLARRLGIADRVVFPGFVEGPDFAALQAGCTVTLNLRYPSSGETSGTLALADGRGATTVVTRYQAFHEVEATESVGFLPGREVGEIADALHRAYLVWRDGTPPAGRRRPRRFTTHRIEALIAAMLPPPATSAPADMAARQ